jgi:hypothetical protein
MLNGSPAWAVDAILRELACAPGHELHMPEAMRLQGAEALPGAPLWLCADFFKYLNKQMFFYSSGGL